MDRESPKSVVVGAHKQAQVENGKMWEPSGRPPTAATNSDGQGVLYKLVKVNPDGSYTAVSEAEASRLLPHMLDTSSLSDSSDSDSDEETDPPFAHQDMKELQAEEHRLLQKMQHLNDMLHKFEEEDQQRQTQARPKCAPGFPSALRDAVGGSASTKKRPPQPNGNKSNGVLHKEEQEQDKVRIEEMEREGNRGQQEGHVGSQMQPPAEANGHQNGPANGCQLERGEKVEPIYGGGRCQQDMWQDRTVQQPSFLDVPRVSRKQKRGATRPRRNLDKLLGPLREAVRRKTAPLATADASQESLGKPLHQNCGERTVGNSKLRDERPQTESASKRQANGQGRHVQAPSLPPLLHGFEGFDGDITALPSPGPLSPWMCGRSEDSSFVKAFDLQTLEGELSLDQAWEEGLNRADLELGISTPRKNREAPVDLLQPKVVHGKANGTGGMNGAGATRLESVKKQKNQLKEGPNGLVGCVAKERVHHETSGAALSRIGTVSGDVEVRPGQKLQQAAPLAGRDPPVVAKSSIHAAVKFVNKAARDGETPGAPQLSRPKAYPPDPFCSSQLDKSQPFARPAAKRSKLLPAHKSNQARAGNENRVPGGSTGLGNTKYDPLLTKKSSGSSQPGGAILGNGAVAEWGNNVGRSGS